LLAAVAVLAVFSAGVVTRVEQIQPTSGTTGALNIHITGARAGVPVIVQAESRHRGRMDTLPPGEDTVTFTGLELGANYVWATQEGLVSGLVEVILDTRKAGINVHLELDVNHAELVVPVHNATVRALRRAAPPFREVGADLQPRTPGRYDLSAIQPGTPLLVQAEGFAPVCRVVTRNEVDTVQLEPGRQVHVTFPPDVTPAVLKELTALDDVPGSNCLLPLWAFAAKLDPSSAPPWLFTMSHFPSAQRFRLIRSGAPDRRIFVPQSGTVMVESP
jgi:hypothetical protein